MEECTIYGTASIMSKSPFKIPGVRVAGKTGNRPEEDNQGRQNSVTSISAGSSALPPSKIPEIAVAVMIEGNEVGETIAGEVSTPPGSPAQSSRNISEKKANR